MGWLFGLWVELALRNVDLEADESVEDRVCCGCRKRDLDSTRSAILYDSRKVKCRE